MSLIQRLRPLISLINKIAYFHKTFAGTDPPAWRIDQTDYSTHAACPLETTSSKNMQCLRVTSCLFWSACLQMEPIGTPRRNFCSRFALSDVLKPWPHLKVRKKISLCACFILSSGLAFNNVNNVKITARNETGVC